MEKIPDIPSKLGKREFTQCLNAEVNKALNMKDKRESERRMAELNRQAKEFEKASEEKANRFNQESSNTVEETGNIEGTTDQGNEKEKAFLEMLCRKLGFFFKREVRVTEVAKLIEEVEIGGKTKDQLRQDWEENNIEVSDYANKILESGKFVISKESKKVKLIALNVGVLGFLPGEHPTLNEIIDKAKKEWHLNTCAAETALYYIQQNKGRYHNFIAMDTINLGVDAKTMELGYSEADEAIFNISSGIEGERPRVDGYSVHLKFNERNRFIFALPDFG